MSFKVLSSPSGNIWMAQSSLPHHHALNMGSSLPACSKSCRFFPNYASTDHFLISYVQGMSQSPSVQTHPLSALPRNTHLDVGLKKTWEILLVGGRVAGMSWIRPRHSRRPMGRNANPAGLVRGPRASKRLETWEKRERSHLYLGYTEYKYLGCPKGH